MLSNAASSVELPSCAPAFMPRLTLTAIGSALPGSTLLPPPLASFRNCSASTWLAE